MLQQGQVLTSDVDGGEGMPLAGSPTGSVMIREEACTRWVAGGRQDMRTRADPPGAQEKWLGLGNSWLMDLARRPVDDDGIHQPCQ